MAKEEQKPATLARMVPAEACRGGFKKGAFHGQAHASWMGPIFKYLN
jgi:hypothetical protein